ncbi:MAG: 2-amino-4-hydroxy-6-hydroxymethyldihydropteridine diphosphokinase [Candidatus Omnitrophica bacterium]|nr:2-amino-4-hydroxy-6-hydroxymethyldihydropteridine diphosphokinase [Candidatus Omnitrophota bacterium]
MGGKIRKPPSTQSPRHPAGKPGNWETGGLVTCFLGLGSNLGDRRENIRLVLQHLKKNKQIKIQKLSSIIETEPILPKGAKPQGKFLNAVVKIKTGLLPQDLLTALKEIEKKMGRKAAPRFSPRVIDLDILLYGDKQIEEENLKIPHPQIQERKFVKKLLGEISYKLQATSYKLQVASRKA